VLIKVAADERTRSELMNIVTIFRGKIIDVGRQSYIIEITGGEDKIAAILQLVQPFGISEIVRTGRVAMFRGTRTLAADGDAKENVA
jgi:acetolactate synthase I/III small subunit